MDKKTNTEKAIWVSEETHKDFKILAAELSFTFDEALSHIVDYFRNGSRCEEQDQEKGE